VIATSITIVFIVAFILIAYSVAEARIFRMLTSQPGVTIKIGSRHGNLFTGYTLTDISVHQNPTRDRPGSSFSTPKLTIHWKLRPMTITNIAWDDAKYKLEPEGKQMDEIPIGAGAFTLSTDPKLRGWLAPEKPIIIGPRSWNGYADLNLRADGKQILGKIHVERLPLSYLSLATQVPAGFTPSGDVVLDIDVSGSPQNLQVSGTVSDPATFKAFHF
jgi:hypothetical protein